MTELYILKRDDFKEQVKVWRTQADEIVKRGLNLATEIELREALELYEKCFWFYPGQRNTISVLMRKIGKYLRERHGCALKFCEDRELYYSTCPNHLIQFDFGFSLRTIEEHVCSVCKKPPIECEHLTGDIYDGVEAKTLHKVVDIITADWVEEPEMPFARVREKLISRDKIEEGLGTDPIFKSLAYGNVILNCDHCLQNQTIVINK